MRIKKLQTEKYLCYSDVITVLPEIFKARITISFNNHIRIIQGMVYKTAFDLDMVPLEKKNGKIVLINSNNIILMEELK